MSGLTPANPLSYKGQVVVPFIMEQFPPQSTFNQFSVPTIWVDYVAKNAYMLTAKPQGVAEWVHLGGVPGEIDTITTPDAVVVVPTAANVNFLNGTGMSITGSGSNITFNASAGGLAWTSVTGLTQALVESNGYVANNAGARITFSLPATADVGDLFVILGVSAGGWSVSQAAGQQMLVGSLSTTLGAGGSIASVLQSDSVWIRCVTANTTFKIENWQGNITVV